jgi:hypothetical protein
MQWQCLESKMAAAAWALIAFMALEDPTEIITEPRGYYASLEACQQAAERKKTLDGFLCKIGQSAMVVKLLGRSMPAQSFIELILRASQESSMGFPETSNP